MKTSICCSRCNGSGAVELTGVLAEALAILVANPACNGAKLSRMANIGTTAMNNRLVALERLGLADGQRFGRERLWSATTSPRKENEEKSGKSPTERTKEKKEKRGRRCEA